MNLTNVQRVRKLVGNLICNPDLLFPYLRMSIFSRKLPIDLEMPWWSFRAIERADGLLAGRRIFEYGTGGSTIRYAKIANRIVSVEDHEAWFEVVKSRLSQRRILNVELHLCPFDSRSPVSFEMSEYISIVDSSTWDVVIIDGQEWGSNERIKCFRRCEPRMEAGSIIIVDDFWRYEELLQTNRAKAVEIYESVGPARLGVTSTAFFFY